jgi:hypothetical protein
VVTVEFVVSGVMGVITVAVVAVAVAVAVGMEREWEIHGATGGAHW